MVLYNYDEIKISENEKFLAFLDVFPLVHGHILVIPKKEVDYIFDLDIEMLSGLHVFSQKIAKALDKAVPCKRVAVIVLGLEVPHAHIHLIPMDAESDVRFSNPKLKLSPEEFQQIATEIKKHL